MGGKFHLKLNIGERPIANKYREGKMKSTLKRVLNSRGAGSNSDNEATPSGNNSNEDHDETTDTEPEDSSSTRKYYTESFIFFL